MATAYKHQQLLDFVFANIDRDKLTQAMSQKKSSERTGSFQEIAMDALKLSPIGVFNNDPYYFTGKVYEKMPWTEFTAFVQDMMQYAGLPAKDNGKYGTIKNYLCATVAGKELIIDNNIVVMRNGVYSFNDNQLHSFSPEFIQTTYVDYDYDSHEFCRQWQDFLDFVLPNKRLQMVLQEFLGAAFINRNDEKVKIESMLVLLGRTGANGKSVVFETVLGVLGKHNVTTFSLDNLVKGTEKLNSIASINGKRLNYSSEARCIQIDNTNADTIKTLISGEPIVARQLYKEAFTAHNIPLLMMNANKMPRILDPSASLKRRIIIIPFEKRIPLEQQDKEMAQHLVPEYSGIFNWIIEGRQRLIKNKYKFTVCTEISSSVDEWYASANTAAQFMWSKGYAPIFDSSVNTYRKEVPANTLYKRYVAWCQEPGTDHTCQPEDVRTFGRMLTDEGYQRTRTSKGNVYSIYIPDDTASHYNKVNNSPEEQWREKVGKVVINGRKQCAVGFEGLAAICGISINTVKKLFRNGEFEGMYHTQGRRKYFHLSEITTKLHKLGIKRITT
jgi:P4 family phage/plasmid primase-like protien